jgi:hypothetical protein
LAQLADAGPNSRGLAAEEGSGTFKESFMGGFRSFFGCGHEVCTPRHSLAADTMREFTTLVFSSEIAGNGSAGG